MSVAKLQSKANADRTSRFDAIVVGAGLGGIYMFYVQVK